MKRRLEAWMRKAFKPLRHRCRFSISTLQRFNKARILWLVPLLVSGCATFHPSPLPQASDLMRSPALSVPVSQLDLPGLKPHPFNPAKGLDQTTVITLAVLNNPDLKAARLQAGVAGAQVLEAGLLPDPVVSGGLSQSPVRTGYNIGLGEDLQALITRGAAKAAAKAHARQVNLEILWQEWQVAERARELFIHARADGQLLEVLTRTRDLFAERYRRVQAAFRRHEATAAAVSADLTALAGADTQRRRLELHIVQTRHALNALLGLEPDVNLHLTGWSPGTTLSAPQFRRAVAALPHRRADLLALQAGYRSQQQRLREAILAQFPAMNAGVEQAKSAEEGVHTIGLTVNLTLPLFNRNRGQIAIQRATRAVLKQTYQARLDQAVSDADRVWQTSRILARQLRTLESRLPVLMHTAAASARSFRQGNLDLNAYVRLESNCLTQQAQVIRLRASLAKARSALATVLALPFGSPSPAMAQR